MARKAGSAIGSGFFLQLSLGAFFLVLGISDLGSYDSSLGELRRAFGRNDALFLITAVIEVVMGVVLVLGLFMPVSAALARFLGLALFVLWAAYMFIALVARNFLEPNVLTWLYRLAWHSVILVSLWIVGRKYL
jgi:hypothetical protein